MTWKKRIISIALCLCALLCAASVRAEAEDAATTHTDHPICGANHKDVGDHTSDNCSTPTWTAWNGGDIPYDTNNVAYIYLSDDVTLQINNDFGKPKSLDVGNGKTLYLCLNGHSLTNRGSNTICVYGTLVLCDCKGGGQNNGTITHTKDKDGSFTGSEGIHVDSGAAFIMYGGTISGNNGGVQVYKSTFTMYGGKISGNAGRGVLVSGGTFTMYGGEISHNTCITTSAEGGGGVWVKDNGSNIGNFAMYGGTICNNTYKGIGNCGGGGVYASGTGDFIIQGGTITGNQCSYNGTSTSNGASGGGLYISDAHSKLRIENSTISNNTCDGDGGGIFIISNVTGSITNCTISNNSATGASSKGGGLAFDTATVTITGGSITDNKTMGKGGGMAVESWGKDSNLTLSGSMNFSGNAQGCTADENGKLTGGTANDVHLNTSSVYLRLASDFSKTSTAPIVVTTAFEPNANGYKKIAVDNRTTPVPTDFKYGNDDTAICTYTVTEGGNKTVELRACKHSGAWKPNTDDASSGHWRKCTNCDTTQTAAHTEKIDAAVEPTCTATGLTEGKHCSVCGAVIVAQTTVPAKAHDWGTQWISDDSDKNHHWHKCNNCNAINTTSKAPHDWNSGTVTTPATCTTPGEKTYTCGTCNAKKTEEIPASGHTEVIDAAVEATCTEPGKTEGKHCSVCNAVLVAQKVVPAKGHTEVVDAAVEATCTKTGLTEGKHCSVCNTVLVEQTTIPAKGHTEVIDAAVEATCTEPGKTEGKHCSVCNTVLVEQTTVPAKGHTEVVDAAVEATCTKTGLTEGKHCSVCNAVLVAQQTVPVKAHDYDTTKWVKADENQHGHKCKNCDAITDLTAHVPGAAATETTPQLCTECGYVIAPATHPEHTWVFVAETPATCNATGVKEHYKCDCRRKSVTDGVYDIVSDTELILAINPANHTGAPDSKWHSDSANHWQEYTCCHARANEAAHSGGAATCTAQAVCQVCGKAYGPLAAHAWQPATCTAPKTCTACHVTEGAALGHDWGAWKVTAPATKDAPGVETRTCTHNSAHTETRSIPKLSTTVYTVSEDTKIAQIEAKVDGLDKILESDENKALVNDGKSVGVSLTVKNTASSGVSEKIKEKLAGSNLVGLRLELTVEKTVTANGVVESKQTIPDAGVLLKTTITLPAELQGKSGYVVYRLHDGNVHVLTETANENGEFITVSADKTQITICARLYSEYVIAYQTGGSSGGGYHPVNPTPVKATSANTGDAGVLLYGVTAALSLTGTAWLGVKSRKH